MRSSYQYFKAKIPAIGVGNCVGNYWLNLGKRDPDTSDVIKKSADNVYVTSHCGIIILLTHTVVVVLGVIRFCVGLEMVKRDDFVLNKKKLPFSTL